MDMGECGIAFESIKLDGKPLKDCEMALETSCTNYRLYVSKYEDAPGFGAVAVNFVCCELTKDDLSHWDSPNLRVEKVFRLTAPFDGAKHIHFNEEDDGYLYYPEMDSYAEIFKKVRELEIEHCPRKAEQIAKCEVKS